MSYETDDEKVEAIKKWWKENGLSVAAGIALGLTAILGWRTWVDHRDQVAGAAAGLFEQLLISADSGQTDAARAQARQLQDDYGATPYAALGQLALARVLQAAGDAAGARSALEQVSARAPDPALARLAALRLARLLVDAGELDAAAALLTRHDDGAAFAGEFAVVRGDIAIRRGDQAGARAAYEIAIASGTGLTELIRLKLDDLPAPPASG